MFRIVGPIALVYFMMCGAVTGLAQVRGRGAVTQLDSSLSFQIDGVVLNDKTGEPLANVTVTAPSGIYTVSDAMGNFHLEGIKPGTIRLLASRAGYAGGRPSLDRRIPGNNGITVNALAGQHMYGLTIHMVPSPIVTGRVVNPEGRPVVGAEVIPFRPGYDDEGQRTPKYLSPQVSDDRGEFRFSNLDPGEYGFKVEPAATNAGNVDSRNRMTNYSSIYFPGTSDPLNAASIHLEAGAETNLGSLSVTPEHAFNLHLMLTSETGLSEVFSVRIRRRGDSNTSVRTFSFGRAAQTETNIGGLSSGTYELLLGGSSGPALRTLYQFEIGQSDLSLSLSLLKAVPLKARAVKKTTEGEFLGVAGVEMECLFDGFTANALIAVVNRSGADGVFGPNPNVGTTPNKVRIRSLPPGFYVTSVEWDGKDVLREGIDVRESPTVVVTIMLEEGAGVVRGVAKDGNGMPISGATVAVIPDDRSRSTLYASTTADGDGKFELQSAPGEFHLYAWREMDGAAFRNLEFIKLFDANGQSVHIEKNSQFTINPRILD